MGDWLNLFPNFSEFTLCGIRIFAKVMRFKKMRSLGWTLMSYDCYPKKGRRHLDTFWAEEASRLLEARKEAWNRQTSPKPLDFEVWMFAKDTCLWHFVVLALGNQN